MGSVGSAITFNGLSPSELHSSGFVDISVLSERLHVMCEQLVKGGTVNTSLPRGTLKNRLTEHNLSWLLLGFNVGTSEFEDTPFQFDMPPAITLRLQACRTQAMKIITDADPGTVPRALRLAIQATVDCNLNFVCTPCILLLFALHLFIYKDVRPSTPLSTWSRTVACHMAHSSRGAT